MTLHFKALCYQRDSFILRADLSLPPAKRFVLLAPSGSGKSTLLDLIAGFLSPQSGQILWHERDLTREKVGKRPVSYLFQHNNLFAHLSVWRNLALVNNSRDAINKALWAMGLPDDYLKKFPAELSGGEQQRVALARTLLQKRPIILLDEPFSALDPDTKAKVCDLTVQVQREQSALLLAVSHDAADTERLQAEALTIEDGVLKHLKT
ncbi:MAG: ATP-binding cassette domain-containing protein [Cardiobacteriaceae bacterium]|nr:ATP-binding cassette domain-containing protein [Cardiobacteriaceae bacterium]